MVYFILCRSIHHVQQMESALVPPKCLQRGEQEAQCTEHAHGVAGTTPCLMRWLMAHAAEDLGFQACPGKS